MAGVDSFVFLPGMSFLAVRRTTLRARGSTFNGWNSMKIKFDDHGRILLLCWDPIFFCCCSWRRYTINTTTALQGQVVVVVHAADQLLRASLIAGDFWMSSLIRDFWMYLNSGKLHFSDLSLLTYLLTQLLTLFLSLYPDFKMILLLAWLALPWTRTLCSGKPSFSARTILPGKEAPSNSYWNFPKTTPTRLHRCDSWPKCFIPIFTMMVKFVWIFCKISGRPFTIFRPFWRRFSRSCAIQIRRRQPIPKRRVFTMKIGVNTIDVWEKLSNKVGLMNHKGNTNRESCDVCVCDVYLCFEWFYIPIMTSTLPYHIIFDSGWIVPVA